MKKCMWVTLFFASLGALYAQDAKALLDGIDNNRKIGDQFAFRMEVSSFVDDKLYETHGLCGYVFNEKGKKPKSLIYFVSPANVKDRKMFIDQNYIWILFPRTKNAIRLSPLQILLGEVAYGDILQLSYSTDYTMERVEETNKDGKQVYDALLKVKKEAQGVTYATIHLLVDKELLTPVYAEYYSSSDKLLKTAIFRNTQKVLNAYASMEIEIRDAVKTNRYSIMKYEKIVTMSLKAAYFNKEYLSRFELMPVQ